jgi:hypothetical protein
MSQIYRAKELEMEPGSEGDLALSRFLKDAWDKAQEAAQRAHARFIAHETRMLVKHEQQLAAIERCTLQGGESGGKFDVQN